MNPVTLRRYVLNSGKEGWAIIVIGSDGYFSTVSDWGNYSYLWTDPGCEFRYFLTRCEPDSFWHKITQLRESYVIDSEKTEQAIRVRLNELVAQGLISEDEADDSFEEAKGSIHSVDDLYEWFDITMLPEDFNVYDGILVTKKEQQSWTFATKIFTQFQALLRAELAKEEKTSELGCD